ncbi:hypothetical protein CBOM_07638 [Ceraceosorus bombacis]|uniref:Uncharacterized protein n=1 Tax=Ceraceosorus bombacis TaxID=401625 RepID=A0A0P1BLL4_9BASI|nr:hypothetical protein CBOM_07638 [Ceraceosorus bombacis]
MCHPRPPTKSLARANSRRYQSIKVSSVLASECTALLRHRDFFIRDCKGLGTKDGSAPRERFARLSRMASRRRMQDACLR